MKAILAASSIGMLALSDPTFAATQTFLGSPANNALGGQVQVQITVDGGKITAISTPVTLSGRNAQYANYAVPTLTSRALAAQSANIQGVSGASYVSSAWKQSLASAIANAGPALSGAVTTTPVTPVTPVVPAPAKTIAPAPAAPQPRGQEGGGDDFNEHEGGGDDGGVIVTQPRGEHHGRPVAPVSPIVPKTRTVPAAPKASATPVAPAAPSLGLTMGAGVIKKSITCVKGSLTKTVKAVNPKCPTGYTLKKK